MLGSYVKKRAVIGNISVPMIDSKRDLKKTSYIQNLEKVKCIIWNIKLNQGNKEVAALLDSDNKANLIFQAYEAQLPIQIINIS